MVLSSEEVWQERSWVGGAQCPGPGDLPDGGGGVYVCRGVESGLQVKPRETTA